jgi:hypothetical protein
VRLLKLAVGVVAIAAAAGGIYGAYGSATTKHHPVVHRLRHATLRPTGLPVTFTGRGRMMLKHVGATGPSYFVATRAGRSFYRLTNPRGQTCFGSGPDRASAGRATLGVAMCSHEFPSVGLPVLDLSVYDWPRGGGPAHAYRLEGVAVDGVAAVDWLDTDGAVVASVPVVDNIYRATSVPKEALSRVVAVDASQRPVWASPLDR